VQLGGPMRLERRDELRRKRDRAPALVGFQFGEVEPANGTALVPGLTDP
jgi:hypothetical protein